MLFSNVLVISSLLAGFAQAAPARGPQVSLSTLVGDIVCPRGTSLFHAQTDGLVPNTTPSKVWQHIGNFENADWRDLDLLSTTGLPNAGGSGRSYYMKGAVITEQLNINVGSASGATPYLPYFYQQYNIIGTSTLAGAKISKVHNFLSVSKKSDGAYINWEVVGCADDTDNAEVLFEQVAQGGIKKTIAKFRG